MPYNQNDWRTGSACIKICPIHMATGDECLKIPGGWGGGGGGGALGYLGRRIRSLSKFKNTPKALISGIKAPLS